MVSFNASEYLLDRRLEAGDGDRVAIRERARSVTYAQLHERVGAAARGLIDLGVRPEERVALVLLDGLEFVATFLGAMRIGSIPLPLNPLLPGRDIAVAVADARARVAVVAAAREALPGELADGAPELTDVVLVGDTAASAVRVRLHGFAETLAEGSDPEPYPTWDDSPGFWLCTSGTTGKPKLAMHRHADLRLTAEGYAREVLQLAPEDRCFSVAPLFHAYGLGNSLGFPLSVGATAILEPTRPPTPSLVAEVVAREEPTLYFSVPTSYAAVLAADLPPDTFASVRIAVSAGEPLPADLYHRFLERFGVEILDGIGSTELTHIYVSNRRGRVRPGTSGQPVGGHRVRVEDDDGNDAPADTPGQLVVAGASLATGYWCRTDATRERFRGEWFVTGDMYSRSADGCFTYLGRADDMLKVAGEWVSPAEVESVLVEHPDVLEAAVVGETVDGLTRPVAFVVAVPDRIVEEDDVIEHCRARLAGFKRPRRVVVVDTLPKTVTGKVQRALVRELAEQARTAVAR